ncbi:MULTISPECIES: trypsin-like peptidase domain-containing protein [Mycolicibacterium]|uniref:trypsin-like peptidase domain-containing protein n=1 Tax=Mycolicibacterium TaxID=1866885 RepID=UPI000FB78DF3|nr:MULTISPECIES: trypsin-like peptidase domain-containing protein [Mycolicibacterium]RUP26200.1 MAG: serine protease [Mycolicibacterium sp.]UCZ59708.1 serine protease [Mycolicibacterium phocaicum]
MEEIDDEPRAQAGGQRVTQIKASIQASNERVDSYVVPLITGLVTPKGDHPLKAKCVEGTGFLLSGGRGLGVTARHVAQAMLAACTSLDVLYARIDTIDEVSIPTAGFVGDDGYFRSAPVMAFDLHPTEDVALFRLPDDDYYSPYTITTAQHFGGADYGLWGYPDDVRYDYYAEDNLKLNVPLVFSAGHIRRRISTSLPINTVRGQKFYELSAPAGACSSGAPVAVRHQPWQVIGLYVGERRNESGTFSVGFATRSEAIAEHWPQLVDGSDLTGLCPLPQPAVDGAGAAQFWAEVNSHSDG